MRVVKSRMLRWTGQVTWVWEASVFVGNLPKSNSGLCPSKGSTSGVEYSSSIIRELVTLVRFTHAEFHKKFVLVLKETTVY